MYCTINDVYKVLDSMFRDLGLDEPTQEDYVLVSDVIENCPDVFDCFDEEIDDLRENLYHGFLEEEIGYDSRGRMVIDIALDIVKEFGRNFFSGERCLN